MTKHSDQATALTYPQTLYPSLEEKVIPAIISDYATNWVHISEFEDSRKEDLQRDNLEQKIQKSVTFDEASGQPPNYFQLMGTQHILTQHTDQHGYGQFDPAQINMNQTNLVQQRQLNPA